MRFMFQYPDAQGSTADLLDAGPVAELAVAAERAGWHGFAFTEHPATGARWLASGGHQTLDPFVALGGVATVTTRLRLLSYLAVLPYRNPLLLAKAAMTVDRLSNGRFILGAGAGYSKGEFAALGVNFDERNELFDEALAVLPLHWSGEPFDFQGKHFSARNIQSLPRPAQNPIPIWVGGNSKLTRRRVAERCQGWMPLVGPAEMFATTRTPAPGTLAELKASVEEIKRSAAARSAKLDFAMAYTDPSITHPRSEVDRHRQALAGFEAAGFTWMIVNRPTAPRAQILEFIAEFAETYIRV